MSLSGALNNALSGLTANARAAGLVSTNIANANTENYGRRTLALSSRSDGTTGGVFVEGTIRHVNETVLSDRRQSDAALSNGESLFAFSKNLELSVGSSDDPGSLTNRMTNLENAFLSAASNPASTQRLESVAYAADALAEKLRTVSAGIQEARTEADGKIAIYVERLNDTLVQIDEINTAIIKADATRSDSAGMRDERQRLVDKIADIVPIRKVEKEHGEIAIYTSGGAILLDGNPAVLGFEQTYSISDQMTLAGGDLSGITLNGNPITTTSSGILSGGDLAAQLQIRDETGPLRQAELDGIARDLIERMGPGGPDATLGATDAGLFTDFGAAFDSLDEVGIAGRISLNALVAPGSGGSWRFRDGLNAPTQGAVGDASLLQGYSAAISELGVPSSTSLPPVTRSFADRIADFSSEVTSARVREEANQTYLASKNTTLSELDLSFGVDTDQELQRLMQIEQQYAANARMMTVVDEMLQRLMAI